MIHTLRECPEIGTGAHRTLPIDNHAVLAHVAEAPSGTVLFAHNLGDAPARLALTGLPGPVEDPLELFSDGEYDETLDLDDLPLRPYGYRRVRLRRTQVYG